MKGSSSRSRLLLMELILNLLLFAIAAVVCLQLFAQAHLKSQQSQDLALATLQLQTVAEGFKATGADLTALQAQVGGTLSGQVLRLSYDESWQPTGGPAAYTLTLTASEDAQGMVTGDLSAARSDGQTLLGLTVRRYVQGVTP